MALPEDFSKIFGSTATGGLTPIGDVNYAKGWEFVGANPPTKNDFSYLQNLSDLKSQWLYSNKLQRKDPFGDIKSDGTVQKALENLGLGDAAQRSVGNGVGQIPDMSLFGVSRSSSGYQKLPSGLIIQWGANVAGVGGDARDGNTVNFPIAFPIYCAQVITTFDNGSANIPAGAASLGSLTSFTLRCSAASGGYTFRWLAIGY